MSSNEELWLVAITAGRWQKHGISEAKKAGIKVIAIDADPEAEGFQVADKYFCMNIDNHDAVIKTLRDLNINIRGAVSFCSEAGMLLASCVRESFDLPGPRTELSRSMIDKGIQRSVWNKAGVPSPQFKIFSDKLAIQAEIPIFGFPSIIKPTDSSGSRGVTKLESLDDNIVDAVERAFHFSKSGEVILEKYMQGTEFTIEVFGVNGEIHVLAVTEKKKVEGTRDTVARELVTSERTAEVIKRIVDTVINAFIALGYLEGPGHAEAILMDDGSVGLVEVAGRGGGFMVFDKFVPMASGINIARLTALQSVGLTIDPFISNYKATVLRFFPAQAGTLQAIYGFNEANEITGVEADSFVEPGVSFEGAMVDGDRLGFILSCAETLAEAQYRADLAESKIFYDFI